MFVDIISGIFEFIFRNLFQLIFEVILYYIGKFIVTILSFETIKCAGIEQYGEYNKKRFESDLFFTQRWAEVIEV